MSHLLFQRTTGGEIADGANVFFNNQVWLSDDITYNEDTGVFTIETEGVYEINWNIAAQSSQAATGLSFVIDAAGSTDITDSTPIKTGQLSGISVIVADQPPVDFSLRNVSGQSVYLPDQTDVKATISLISVGGPPGATGATGPEGPPGASAIIPYSSGSPVTLTSLVGGLVGLPAFVGFGSSAQGIDALGATINLEGTVSSALTRLTLHSPYRGTALSQALPPSSVLCWLSVSVSAITTSTPHFIAQSSLLPTSLMPSPEPMSR